MFKIGYFSMLSRVPVKTLRYYDQIGLLKPAHVDRFSGYRYYSIEQLPRLNRILALKDLGFKLEQIAQVLEEDLSMEQFRGMLRLKRAEVERDLQAEQARLARIEFRLRQIEQEDAMPEYEVVIKKIEPIHAAVARQVVPTYAGVGGLLGQVFGELGRLGIAPAGPPIAIYYHEGYREKDVDVEVAVPVGGEKLPPQGPVQVRELSGQEQVASLVHCGSYDDFGPAYQALMSWIDASGYAISGPVREIYLRGPGPDVDPADYMTEIQFPVTGK